MGVEDALSAGARADWREAVVDGKSVWEHLIRLALMTAPAFWTIQKVVVK
jgi:hypothetical protein